MARAIHTRAKRRGRMVSSNLSSIAQSAKEEAEVRRRTKTHGKTKSNGDTTSLRAAYNKISSSVQNFKLPTDESTSLVSDAGLQVNLQPASLGLCGGKNKGTAARRKTKRRPRRTPAEAADENKRHSTNHRSDCNPADCLHRPSAMF